MSKSQKDAVIEAVTMTLNNFRPHIDNALLLLTKAELENIKRLVGEAILKGSVAYSKPLIKDEVMAYARSMVMNHLKKAKELNGGINYGANSQNQHAQNTISKSYKETHKGIDLSVLSDELKEYVKTI